MPAYVPEYLKSKNRQTVFNMFVKNMTLSRAQIVQETEDELSHCEQSGRFFDQPRYRT